MLGSPRDKAPPRHGGATVSACSAFTHHCHCAPPTAQAAECSSQQQSAAANSRVQQTIVPRAPQHDKHSRPILCVCGVAALAATPGARIALPLAPAAPPPVMPQAPRRRRHALQGPTRGCRWAYSPWTPWPRAPIPAHKPCWESPQTSMGRPRPPARHSSAGEAKPAKRLGGSWPYVRKAQTPRSLRCVWFVM